MRDDDDLGSSEGCRNQYEYRGNPFRWLVWINLRIVRFCQQYDWEGIP